MNRVLFKRTATYFLGGVVSQGATFCLWLLLPWVLGPSEVGNVILAFFIVDLFTSMGMMGMDSALVRFGVRPEVGAAIAARAMGIVVISSVIVIGLGWVILFVTTSIVSETMTWVSRHYVAISCAILAGVVWNLFQAYQIAAQKVAEYAASQVLRSVLYLVIGIGAVALLPQNGIMVIWASVAAPLLALAVIFKNGGKRGFIQNPLGDATAKSMVQYGWPLMLYAVLGVGVAYTQRLLVGHYTDTTTLGVFGFFNVIVLQLNGLWSSYNKAWTPHFFSLVDTDKATAMSILRAMLVVVAVVYPLLLAGYALAGEYFVNKWLLPETYSNQAENLYVQLLAMFFTGLYTVAYPLYYSALKTVRILIISMILGLINIGLSVVLIRAFGALGASVSLFIFAALTMWTYLLSYRDWATDNGRMATMLLSATIIAVLAVVALVVLQSVMAFSSVLFFLSIVVGIIGYPVALPFFIKAVQSQRHAR